MTNEYLLWIATTAYAVHALEEHQYDWRDWAQKILHLPVDWPTFYMTNAAVMVLGVSCAMVGWRLPEFSLILPALMAINAVFFHILPTVATRRFSPGLVTAVLLFLPMAWWIYCGASRDGVLTTRVLLCALGGGALLMAFPIALLRTKDKPLFRQD